MNLTELLELCRLLDARLPPSPWEADIDDPDSIPDFTGKFNHPPIPHTALCLYNEPKAASNIAMMRNLFHELLDHFDKEIVDRLAESVEETKETDVAPFFSPNEGDFALVKGQPNPTMNGIRVVGRVISTPEAPPPFHNVLIKEGDTKLPPKLAHPNRGIDEDGNWIVEWSQTTPEARPADTTSPSAVESSEESREGSGEEPALLAQELEPQASES